MYQFNEKHNSFRKKQISNLTIKHKSANLLKISSLENSNSGYSWHQEVPVPKLDEETIVYSMTHDHKKLHIL